MISLIYIFSGYLLGSVLFSKLFGRIIKKIDITEDTIDNNPGSANAFKKGGFWVGFLGLTFDLLKGLFPVLCFVKFEPNLVNTMWTAFVVIAPVLGHMYPLFFKFHGGKGIATTFGVTLGLIPVSLNPVLILICTYILFSVIVRINPTFYTTVFTYVTALILNLIFIKSIYINLALAFLFFLGIFKMLISKEEKNKFKLSFLWFKIIKWGNDYGKI